MRDYDCLSIRSGVLHIEGVSTVDPAETIGDVCGRDVIPDRLEHAGDPAT